MCIRDRDGRTDVVEARDVRPHGWVVRTLLAQSPGRAFGHDLAQDVCDAVLRDDAQQPHIGARDLSHGWAAPGLYGPVRRGPALVRSDGQLETVRQDAVEADRHVLR